MPDVSIAVDGLMIFPTVVTYKTVKIQILSGIQSRFILKNNRGSWDTG